MSDHFLFNGFVNLSEFSQLTLQNARIDQRIKLYQHFDQFIIKGTDSEVDVQLTLDKVHMLNDASQLIEPRLELDNVAWRLNDLAVILNTLNTLEAGLVGRKVGFDAGNFAGIKNPL